MTADTATADPDFQWILRSRFDAIVVTTTKGAASDTMHIPREGGGVFCGRPGNYGNPKDPSCYPEAHASPCGGCLAAHPDVPEVDAAGSLAQEGRLLADVSAVIDRMERVDWEDVPTMSAAEAGALTARLTEAADALLERGLDD